MNHKANILKKVEQKELVVGIIGLGYVGLPLAVGFAEAGVHVLGFDKSEQKVNKINSGENYIKDVRDVALREAVENVTFHATTDFSEIEKCNALLICVPTPLDRRHRHSRDRGIDSARRLGAAVVPLR